MLQQSAALAEVCIGGWVGVWVGGAAVPFEEALAHLTLVADHWWHT